MRIHSIIIENFCGISRLELTKLNQSVLITGENGVGKSTVLNAIAFCLGVDVRDAAGNRIAPKDLVGGNGAEMMVRIAAQINDRDLEIEAGIRKDRYVEITDVVRRQPAFLGATGINATYEALYQALEGNKRIVECGLSPRHYLLGPELGETLAAFCGGEVTPDEIQQYCGDHWKHLSKIFKSNPTLEVAGKDAFEIRRTTKKFRDDSKKKLDDVADAKQPLDRNGKPLDKSKYIAMSEAIEDLKLKRDRLIERRGVLSSIGNINIDELKAEKEQLVEHLEKAKSESSKAFSEYSAAKAKRDQFQEKVGLESQEVNMFKAKLIDLDTQIVKLESGAPCSNCGEAMDEKKRKDLLKRVRSDKAMLESEIKSRNIDGMTEELRGLQESVTKLNQDYVAKNEDTIKIGERLRSIEGKIGMYTIASNGDTMDSVNTEIESVSERLAIGEEKLKQLDAWILKSEMIEEIENYESEIAALDFAVKAFRDGEFIKGRLDSTRGVFETACNDALKPFGYQIEVRIDGKDVRVFMGRDGSMNPISRCSKAEIVLAGFAVSTAFPCHGPVLVDDIDAMFSGTKSKFIAALKKLPKVRPVISCGAWTAGEVNVEPIRKYFGDDATVVWLERNRE